MGLHQLEAQVGQQITAVPGKPAGGRADSGCGMGAWRSRHLVRLQTHSQERIPNTGSALLACQSLCEMVTGLTSFCPPKPGFTSTLQKSEEKPAGVMGSPRDAPLCSGGWGPRTCCVPWDLRHLPALSPVVLPSSIFL